MNQILESGQIVNTESGVSCEVGQFLGGGGQGEVYKADVGGKTVALKWYFPAQATPKQREGLETLIKKGPPNDKFLWPLELTSSPDVPGFGYIMPLRGPRFKGIVDLMKRRIEPTFRALATAGLQLADSYLELHAQGFCYRDISFGNVFFDPDSGEALICDNDNVAVDKQEQSGVLGTPRFMAPEIVRGEAKPSTQTDLFSLSVLLFYMLMVHHPLEGKQELAIKCLDLPAMNRLYGTDPLFIFDPDLCRCTTTTPSSFGHSIPSSCAISSSRRSQWACTTHWSACVRASGVPRWSGCAILCSIAPTVGRRVFTTWRRSGLQVVSWAYAGPAMRLSSSRRVCGSRRASSCSTTTPSSILITWTTSVCTISPSRWLR